MEGVHGSGAGLNRFSVIHRCETTGDILEGGNTFVTIAYTDEVLAPVKAEILAVLAPAPSDRRRRASRSARRRRGECRAPT
jgi:hypothetical protein